MKWSDIILPVDQLDRNKVEKGTFIELVQRAAITMPPDAEVGPPS